MSNSARCNDILEEIENDAWTLYEHTHSVCYQRATRDDVKELIIARRRLRLAMTKLGVSHGGNK